MRRKVFLLFTLGGILLISGCKGGGASNTANILDTLGSGRSFSSSDSYSYENSSNLLTGPFALSSSEVNSILPDVSRNAGIDIIDVSVIGTADYTGDLDLTVAANRGDENTLGEGTTSKNIVYHNPEPNTIVLFLISLFGLLGYGGRKLRS